MCNTENPVINDHAGNAFQQDFMLNQCLAKTFVVGLQGSDSQQLSGDSDHEGESEENGWKVRASSRRVKIDKS